MRAAIVCFSLLVLSVGFIPACASAVPATVTLIPPVPIKSGANFFVLAPEQRARIVESLVDAGLKTSDEWVDDGYSLKVLIGNKRATRGCGTVHNITYILSGAGQRLMVIKGRGATGSCQPNILDDMSRKLASFATDG